MHPSIRTVLTLATLALPAVAAAQAPPAAPAAAFPAGTFGDVAGQWRFRGCVDGVIEPFASGGASGRAYCLSGIVTLGTAPGGTETHLWLAANVAHAPSVEQVFGEFGDALYVTGSETSPTCPVACAWSGLLIPGPLPGSHMAFREEFLPPDALPAWYQPTGVALKLSYTLVGDPDAVIFLSDFVAPLSAVPEPATVLLVGAGLAAVGVGARRRRSQGQSLDRRAAGLR